MSEESFVNRHAPMRDEHLFAAHHHVASCFKTTGKERWCFWASSALSDVAAAAAVRRQSVSDFSSLPHDLEIILKPSSG
jgi:hypothetical protein